MGGAQHRQHASTPQGFCPSVCDPFPQCPLWAWLQGVGAGPATCPPAAWAAQIFLLAAW